ncbi:MAG TPA: tetratricopeptide repeat protein [Stellaceae bacterium]
MLAGIGAAHFLSRRFDEAVEKLLPAVEENPTWPTPHRFLAATYAHMGRIEEAHEIVDRLRAVSPLVLGSGQLRKPEHQELLLSGLRLAMGESA